MRFKKLITPLLITVIICATLALGYQQDPLLRLLNPFSGTGQTLKKDDQSAEVKALYSRITNLESKVFFLEMSILPFRLLNPFSGTGQTLKKDDQSAEVKELYSRITNLESKVSLLEKRIEGTPCAPLRERLCVPEPVFEKPRDIPYQQDPLLRLPNSSSGAGQTLKKDDQSAEVKALYSRITNLESKVSLLEKRI
jgi:outer membrane murein-binding lipoprotein Lpp